MICHKSPYLLYINFLMFTISIVFKVKLDLKLLFYVNVSFTTVLSPCPKKMTINDTLTSIPYNIESYKIFFPDPFNRYTTPFSRLFGGHQNKRVVVLRGYRLRRLKSIVLDMVQVCILFIGIYI